jgi:single-stranded-DNA-specific exonuclease
MAEPTQPPDLFAALSEPPSLVDGDAPPSAPDEIGTPLPRAAVKWIDRVVDPSVVDAVARGVNVPPALARVIVGRGVPDVAAAQTYLQPQLKHLPDPLGLAGVDTALDRVLSAIKNGERIGVFGDYDVDGVTSTVLLSEFLERCGAQVSSTIPDRLVEGYGLSRAGVDRLAAAGASLIITVDCGVTAHDEIAYANAKGLDVVVIDHHTVPVTLPRAVSVINPHRADCQRGSEMLCAVGVTFNLCLAIRRALRDRGFFHPVTRPEPDLKDALDLVALGTVADVVPLVGENRVLVSNGLRALRQGKRAGMRALLDVARQDIAQVDAGTLGFQLGPRVNAAGRLGDAMKAVRLLRADDDTDALRLAAQLDAENGARKDLEKQIVAAAIRQVEESRLLRSAPLLVVGDESWHPGVVGIVASRLVDRFGRPAVVVGEGGRGSGRSIERFHLYEGLRAVSQLPDGGGLEGFGGHAHAAGVRVKKGMLERFREALIEHASHVLSAEDLHKVMPYDGELTIADVDLALCRALDQAAPFGRKNPEPTFLFKGIRPTAVREVGVGHLKAVVEGSRYVELIAFGAADRASLFHGPIDVLATPEINEFRGAQTLQLRVKDLR